MGNDDIIQEGKHFLYTLKAPKDRIAVFIGDKGRMKKQLKDELSVDLEIDSREGDIVARSEDSLKQHSFSSQNTALNSWIFPNSQPRKIVCTA